MCEEPHLRTQPPLHPVKSFETTRRGRSLPLPTMLRARHVPASAWTRLSAVHHLAARPMCAAAPSIEEAWRRKTASAKDLTDYVATMSFQELHDVIQERKGPPPTKWFTKLAKSAPTADDMPLVIAAHTKYVEASRFIGVRQSSELIEACIRNGAWATLAEAVGNAAKLQLYIPYPRHLIHALKQMSDEDALEHVAAVHASLPKLPPSPLQTGGVHHAAVSALASHGALEDAATALATAVHMADGGESRHHIWVATFTVLAEAQISAGEYGHAASTLDAARGQLAARGYMPWVERAARASLSKKADKKIEYARAARATRLLQEMEDGGRPAVRKEHDPVQAMGELLAVAVRACAPPPTPTVEAESEEAHVAEPGETEGAGIDDVEAAAAATEGEEPTDGAAAPMLDPLPVAMELVGNASAEARAVARAQLAELGMEVPTTLAAALSK